jgi:hypothetical protein
MQLSIDCRSGLQSQPSPRKQKQSKQSRPNAGLAQEKIKEVNEEIDNQDQEVNNQDQDHDPYQEPNLQDSEDLECKIEIKLKWTIIPKQKKSVNQKTHCSIVSLGQDQEESQGRFTSM